jgi:hypothetical protein
MEEMLSYCGLLCDSCPIHLATLEQDIAHQKLMRYDIAEQCSKYYGMNLLPGEINDCDGCKANIGRLFSGCVKCEIRKCASQKEMENCAFCNEYFCKKLKEHFLLDPESQNRLDTIHQLFKRTVE